MGNMTIPLQFASLYNRQGVFVWSNCLLDLGTDFLAGNMVFVWDVWYLAVASHFHDLYSSLELCCDGPWLTMTNTLCWHMNLVFCFLTDNSCSVKENRPDNFHLLYCLFLCFFKGYLCVRILSLITFAIVMEILHCLAVTHQQLLTVAQDTYQLKGRGICCSLQVEMETN